MTQIKRGEGVSVDLNGIVGGEKGYGSAAGSGGESSPEKTLPYSKDLGYEQDLVL